ncbi:MAG: nitroreductase family protein [Aliishimia sp.]
MPTPSETLTELMKARFSCRAFHPQPIADQIITNIVDTARHTASWCNAQPWQVSITKGTGTDRFRDALYTHATSGAVPEPDLPWPSGYPGIYGDRRRACGWQLYEAVGIQKGDRAASVAQMMENYKLFGAPHVAIIHAPAELGPYGAMDCGGFVTAFCLAAQAQGISTIPQAAIAAHAPFVRDWFGLDGRLVLCAISFGRGDMDHPANNFRTERDTADALIDWKDS